ncbi:hypothetical protein BV372_17655 [Nostoc sp. T09]|nr:hypothetical protein BV372_17655 [Nostoc sp. T09]
MIAFGNCYLTLPGWVCFLIKYLPRDEEIMLVWGISSEHLKLISKYSDKPIIQLTWLVRNENAYD